MTSLIGLAALFALEFAIARDKAEALMNCGRAPTTVTIFMAIAFAKPQLFL